MKNFLLGLLALVAVMAAPVSGYCATTPSTNLGATQVQALKEINNKIAVVHELTGTNLMSADEATKAESKYLQDAQKVVGHPVTAQELQTIVSNADKTEGLSTFWNIVIVFAGIIFLLAILGLIGFYLAPILEAIPQTVYEILAYASAGTMAFSGYLWQPFHIGIVVVEPLWFVIPGALAVTGCFFLTYALHFNSDVKGVFSARSRSVKAGPGFISFPTVMFGLSTFAWGWLAIFYSHMYPDAAIPSVLAFGSVMALQSFLGFSVLTMPGCIALGWEDEAQVPKSVLSSLIILGAYVAVKITGSFTDDRALFETGAIFMGAFVYYLGLLIMSSKWYAWSTKDGRNEARYIGMQIVTIVSGVAAFYIGSTFHIGALLGIGGTFFAIYLLEKYYEIPWKGIGWAWSLLGVAGFLYVLVGFAQSHPQYFVWGIQ